MNDWFISKLSFEEEEKPNFLTILAFPVSIGFLILSFSGKKGFLYFFGLALGSIINFLREQLLAKKV